MADFKTEEELQMDVAVMKKWLTSQPHLPHNIDDRMYRRFLHSCYYNLEKTKKCMELFFTIRANSSELLSNRDPLSEDMKTVFSITNVGKIRLRDKTNLLLWQLNDPGMEKYDYLNDARLFFADADVFILEDDFLETRDVVLLDLKDLSLKFLMKFNVSLAKKLGQYQQEALPVRLKEVHLVNCPSFIDKIFTFVKPFITADMSKLIHFHTPKSETLFKYINKEELPSDYGGLADSMSQLMDTTLKKLHNHREILLNDKLWVADLSKTPKDHRQSKAGLQNGSFRKLELD